MSHFKGIMRNKKGLTLVEVVVAMGLFGVIMVTLFPAFLITNLMNITSREFTDANFEAQSELEEIYNWSKVAGATPTSVLTSAAMGPYACTGNTCTKDVGEYHYIVTFVANSQVSAMTNLVITVSKPSASPDYGKNRAQLELVLKFGG